MNYQEIKAEKADLERDIAYLITEFQRRIELPVCDVDVVMVDVSTPTKEYFSVSRVRVMIQL